MRTVSEQEGGAFLCARRYGHERTRAMLPQGVSEVSNEYAVVLPGSGSSRSVLKVSEQWMDNNPGS